MQNLNLISPKFDSPLTSIILDLEKLKYKRIHTHVYLLIFFQIKEIFQLLESLESVRIEGNNTTLAELVEKTIEGNNAPSEEWKELENIQEALKFIGGHVQKGTAIDHALISEMHKRVVKGLTRDGDRTPGTYRNDSVVISNSEHRPVEPHFIQEQMDELLAFINDDTREVKYDLLVTAIAHHRFVWIHPFRNGNGRVVRLLTYAMLLRQGFLVGDILNPTAIFCNNRDAYYEFLGNADKGDVEGWCHYVLSNLLLEMNKIEQLLDLKYLTDNILFPALDFSLKKEVITKEEHAFLKIAIQVGEFKAGDINKVLRKKHSSEVTRLINKLKAEKMIYSLPNAPRRYGVSLVNNNLLRGVIHCLRDNGFIPIPE